MTSLMWWVLSERVSRVKAGFFCAVSLSCACEIMGSVLQPLEEMMLVVGRQVGLACEGSDAQEACVAKTWRMA